MRLALLAQHRQIAAEAVLGLFIEISFIAAAQAALMEDDGPDTTPEQAAANLGAVFPFYFARLTPEDQAYRARHSSLTVNLAPMVQGNGPAQFASDWRPQLPTIQVPTLVIVGRYDFIQNVPMAEALTQPIPQAQLAIFEESGHFPWVEERERFHEVVRDFLHIRLKATQ